MAPLMTFVIAVRALRRNAMRTALTALGMIIGVAAVIVMMALGSGARDAIETQIRSVGSNLVTVNAGAGRFGPVRGGQGGSSTLTVGDAEAIRDNIPGIRHLTPGLNIRVQAIAAAGNWSTQAQGSNEQLPDIRSWPTQQGSFFSEDDVKRAAKVAVLGSVARDQLFGSGNDPVGQMVRLRNQPFRVVGVLS
jgi:putative ABC transport system permease protein